MLDGDGGSCNIASRCQKYIFHKIKDSDFACRLRKIWEEEQMDFEFDALDLIALISDGSLRDAETMLDQLSLQGKRITTSLVNDLVGVIPNEKLLDLLEVALSSDTGETVKKSKELMDSGLDPVSLMSQLASLIVDIMAGRFHLESSSCRGRNFSWQSCGFIAYIVFEDSSLKSKAEEILVVIKNSIEMALKHHVEVKIGVSPQLPRTNVYYPKGRLQRAPKRRDGRRMYSRDFQASTSLSCFSDKDYGACSTKERINATSEKMTNISTVDGPTLEEEWLEAEKRGAAELARHHRSTALLMQQNGIGATNQNRTSPAVSRPIIYRKNDSHHKIEGSSIVNDRGRPKEWVGEGSNQLNTIVPSLLHSKSVSDKSEEGKGVCGFPCWKTTKAKKQKDQARRSNTAKPMFQ